MLTHPDERSGKPVQIAGDRRSGRVPGPRLTRFCLFRKYHYLNLPLQIMSKSLRNWQSVFPIWCKGF